MGENDSNGLDQSRIRSIFENAGRNLKFDSSAVEHSVQACTDILSVLDDIRYQSGNLKIVGGMAAFPSSQTLAKGLGDRANEDSAHFGQAISEHISTVRALRDAIEAAGKRYVETEGGNVEALKMPHNPSANGHLATLTDPNQRLPQFNDQQPPRAPSRPSVDYSHPLEDSDPTNNGGMTGPK